MNMTASDDIWDDFFGESFDTLNKRIERMFAEMQNINDPNVKTYGYTMYQGPDGVPHCREFGNARDEFKLGPGTVEPFSDVVEENGKVRVTMEIPGVKKEDIVLDSTENSVSVRAETPKKTFTKTVALPCDIKTDSAKAVYNNGILEITFDAAGHNGTTKRISIE